MGGAGTGGGRNSIEYLDLLVTMPFWIEGWVEVNRLKGTDDDWVGLINIAPMIEGFDEVSKRLFGLSKQAAVGSISVPAVAGGRGIPPSASALARASLASIAEHERQFGKGEFGGYTHLTWREVKAASLDSVVVEQSQWSLVFDLLRRLEQDGRFSDDRIRFVVWFNW